MNTDVFVAALLIVVMSMLVLLLVALWFTRRSGTCDYACASAS